MKKRHIHSLKISLPLMMLILILPLLLLFAMVVQYAITSAEERQIKDQERVLKIQISEMDHNLQNIREYIATISENDSVLTQLGSPDGNTRQLQKTKLLEEMARSIQLNDMADAMFIYLSDYGSMVHCGNSKQEKMTYLGIRDLEENEELFCLENVGQWLTIDIEGTEYYLWMLYRDHIYIGAIISVNRTQQMLSGSGEEVSLLWKDFTVLRGDPQVAHGSTADRLYLDGGQYLLAEASSEVLPLKVVQPIEKDTISFLTGWPFWLIAISVLELIAVLAITFWTRKEVLLPLQCIDTMVEEMRQGNLHPEKSIAQSANVCMEIAEIESALDAMGSEIESLKINVYEQQLQRKNTELQYWHEQIKPHFYLNVLNTINSLAQIREYKQIQQMVQYISTYIRNVFQTEKTESTIYEELEITESYLNMQKIRFPECIITDFQIADELLNAKVPFMLIPTFAENTIKHAFDMYQTTIITVIARKVDDDIEIIMQDNGPGYSTEVLEKFNGGEYLDGHFGIRNLQRRINLLYNGNVKLNFANRESGGAEMSILIPAAGDKENGYEHTDRR